MPFIQCDIEAGLSTEKKEALIKTIAQITHQAIGSSFKDIHIIVREHLAINIFEGARVPYEAGHSG